MIELDRHIEILLLSNDCVIVPGFGGFVAHHVDASYDETDNVYLPPLRTLGFNPQLRLNDHLLVQSYIEAYDISYPEALMRVEEEVKELKQHLESEGEYELNDLGLMQLNEEGNYIFTPCEAGVLSPSFYGLSSFEMLNIADFKKKQKQEARRAKEKVEEFVRNAESTAEIIENEPKNDTQDDNNETLIIPLSWLRNVSAVAVAILAFFMISSPVDNDKLGDTIVQESSILPMISQENDKEMRNTLPADVTADCYSEDTIQQVQAVVKEDSTLQEKEPEEYYCIVLASQTSLSFAENFIQELTHKGIADVRTMQMVNTNKVRVIYGTFTTDEEAHDSLRTMRMKDSTFNEAWVLKLKDKPSI